MSKKKKVGDRCSLNDLDDVIDDMIKRNPDIMKKMEDEVKRLSNMTEEEREKERQKLYSKGI